MSLKELIETAEQMQCGPDGSRSTLVSRNITVLGRRTSVRLEPEMWTALRDIAKREDCRIHDICSLIQLRKNPQTSLTAAIRVFLMLYYRASSTEDGHRRCGHGSFSNMLTRARIMPEQLARRNQGAPQKGIDADDNRPGARFMPNVVQDQDIHRASHG